jgi:UDP-glucose 4-epimerase
MEGYTPHKYIDSIAKGTLNVLEYTRQCGAHKIIFPQSLFDISYLFGSKIPISPDAIRKAPMTGDHAIYVIAKMAAVDLIEHYYHMYGIKRFILRLPRIYMFHPNPYTYTDGVKCLISDRYLIQQAIKGEPIEMWGDPERLLETICIKDFLQIIDKCVESPLDGGIYNAGSGGSTLKERIQGIVEVFSPKEHPSPIIHCPEKRSSQQFVLDISKTIKQLQYIPQYSWKDYLLDFKKDMETQPFKKLWGENKDYTM